MAMASTATFLPAEIWQNVFDLLGSWNQLSDMTHAWTTLRLVNSTFKKDIEARFKQLFNKEQVRIRIAGGIYCVTWDTFSEAKARAYDDFITRKHPRSYARRYPPKYSTVLDNIDMRFKQFKEHDEQRVLFQSPPPDSGHNEDPKKSKEDDPPHVSLGLRRLMELRTGCEDFCSGALPADPRDYFSPTALQHFTRRQWKGVQVQKLHPSTEEVDPFLERPIQVRIGSWKTYCPISDIGFDFKNGTLQFAWREILASFFCNMRLARALHSENDTLRASAWKEVRIRQERTHAASLGQLPRSRRCQIYSGVWDGKLETLISRWDSSEPSEEPVLLALRDSKFGQSIKEEVLLFTPEDTYPNPLNCGEQKPEPAYPFLEEDQETKAQRIEIGFSKSGEDVKSAYASVTAAASSKAQLDAVGESIATLKRKRTPVKVAIDHELSGIPEHDDTSRLSIKRRCIDPNATDEGVASKREYKGGFGLVANEFTTDSKRNIFSNKPIRTSRVSTPPNSVPSKTVEQNQRHWRYRKAPSPLVNKSKTFPRDSLGLLRGSASEEPQTSWKQTHVSHITRLHSHAEVHEKGGSSTGLTSQDIEPSIVSTPQSGHLLTPLSAPAKLGWTKRPGGCGRLRGKALQGLDASVRSEGTGSRIATSPERSLPATPRFTLQKKRAFDDGAGEEGSHGHTSSPCPSAGARAKHQGGSDMKALEGIRHRAEASPSPAARPAMKKRKRM